MISWLQEIHKYIVYKYSTYNILYTLWWKHNTRDATPFKMYGGQSRKQVRVCTFITAVKIQMCNFYDLTIAAIAFTFIFLDILFCSKANHFNHPTVRSWFLLRYMFSPSKVFLCSLEYEGVDPTCCPVNSFTSKLVIFSRIW